MKLYFASGNEHKKKEMEELFGPGYQIVLPKEEGIEFDVDENGESFIENALIKAEALYSIVKAPVISDDSGLCVDALGKGPGIHTARFGDTAERKLSSKEKYMLLLEKLEGVENRRACFVSAVVLILSDNRRYIVQEEALGKIAEQPSEGNGGFGYDPVFLSDEAGCSFTDLPDAGKNLYSHRGKAVRKIRKLIEG